jgi:hypothetical protein
MFENIVNQMRFYAVQGIAVMEKFAADQLDQLGIVVEGVAKNAGAVDWVMAEYKKLEKGTILDMTELDDNLLRDAATTAVNEGFKLVGDGINAIRKLIPVSSTTASELPEGGVQ